MLKADKDYKFSTLYNNDLFPCQIKKTNMKINRRYSE